MSAKVDGPVTIDTPKVTCLGFCLVDVPLRILWRFSSAVNTEAVVWSQPIVGLYGIRRGLFALGLKDNEILAMSRPLTTRHELLTANNTTPYIAGNSDLRSGPVVSWRFPPHRTKVFSMDSSSMHGKRLLLTSGRAASTKERVVSIYFCRRYTSNPFRPATW